jgi:hypothetical protein
MTPDAVDRIWKAAGDVSVALDSDALASELEGIASLYRAGTGHRHAPAKRQQRMQRVITAAETLKGLIEGDIRFQRYLGKLDQIIFRAKAIEEVPEKLLEVLGIERGSAFDNLIRMLKGVFEKYFAPAGYTSDPISGEINGAFIEFAEATLRELDINNGDAPYARKSIAEALRKSRNPQIGGKAHRSAG